MGRAEKVGVVMAAYNVRPYVENTLTTVKAQTYPCAAYVVDDASDDGTYEHIRAHPEWCARLDRHKKRRGWPLALNAAARLAINDGCTHIFVMNADDFLRLDCIERCVDLLPADWVLVYAQQVGAENVVQASKTDATLADFAVYPPFVNYALVPSELWVEVGGYSADVTMPGSWGYKEDWDFWIKLFRAGYGDYRVVTEPVYYYLMHPGQLHEEGLARHEEAKALILAKHAEVFDVPGL